MQDRQYIPMILIFAANSFEKSCETQLMQRQIPYGRVKGRYAGKDEESFLLVVVRGDEERHVRMLCDLYGQECYLRSEGGWQGDPETRHTVLVNTKGELVKVLGTLKAIPKYVADKSDGYFFIPELDTYYKAA